MRSTSGSRSAPTFGSRATSGGQLSKLLTPITCGPAPMANSISVTAGTSETTVGRTVRARPAGGRSSRAGSPQPANSERATTKAPAAFLTSSHPIATLSFAASCRLPAAGYRRLRSSHRKNGPPMSAVRIPTGSSMGAMIVRDAVSHAIRKPAPKSVAAGSTIR
ncbi:MAG: hypothetical protein H6Q10_1224 [Acidobacteria bacterium]|nr:hypothetical protein [Acidobacteriota bacterium]